MPLSMSSLRASLLQLACVGTLWFAPAVLQHANAAPPSVEDFAARSDFEIVDAKLSPNGEYLALIVPLDDRSGLVTLRIADFTRVGAVQAGKNRYIAGVDWVGSDRLVYSLGEKFGELERPQSTGELLSVGVDGKRPEILIGVRAGDAGGMASRIQRRVAERVLATLVAPAQDDPMHLLVTVTRFDGSGLARTQIDRMDMRNGRRTKLADAPVRRADFLLDHAQRVRFTWGAGSDNVNKLYYRDDKGSEWVLVNDEAQSARTMIPLGFSADNSIAYVLADEAKGTSSVQAFDPTTRAFREVVRDAVGDPTEVLYSPRDDAPYGVIIGAGVPKALYFDPKSPDAILHRMLQDQFAGQTVRLATLAEDGENTLFTVAGDRNSGEIYAFNIKTKKARFLGAADSRMDPETLGTMQPFDFKARDGLQVHGYLTLPPGSSGKQLPMVVMPHGGPFGIRDTWNYDSEAQLLATRGYAVLQPNFRGSSGHGRAYQQAGHKQWGRAMQDDVTDATRWAIEQGIADPSRICIHGGSYGAYAALMGVAREPALYRCASGNIGVYDLRAMHNAGDIASVKWGKNYLRDVMDMDRLEADSPALQADKIRVPVLLSAGAEDERAPPLHTERMQKALIKAGVPVEMKIYPGEGHGYFLIENRVDYFNRLLGFFDRRIGTLAAAAAPAVK